MAVTRREETDLKRLVNQNVESASCSTCGPANSIQPGSALCTPTGRYIPCTNTVSARRGCCQAFNWRIGTEVAPLWGLSARAFKLGRCRLLRPYNLSSGSQRNFSSSRELYHVLSRSAIAKYRRPCQAPYDAIAIPNGSMGRLCLVRSVGGRSRRVQISMLQVQLRCSCQNTHNALRPLVAN